MYITLLRTLLENIFLRSKQESLKFSKINSLNYIQLIQFDFTKIQAASKRATHSAFNIFIEVYKKKTQSHLIAFVFIERNRKVLYVQSAEYKI